MNGEGLRDLYPPIKGSAYLANQNGMICIIKNGLEGVIKVNGKEYNQKMPPIKGLYNLDLAQLLTFLNDKYGTSKKVVETDEVSKVNCE